jgi:hypothetical protein
VSDPSTFWCRISFVGQASPESQTLLGKHGHTFAAASVISFVGQASPESQTLLGKHGGYERCRLRTTMLKDLLAQRFVAPTLS